MSYLPVIFLFLLFLLFYFCMLCYFQLHSCCVLIESVLCKGWLMHNTDLMCAFVLSTIFSFLFVFAFEYRYPCSFFCLCEFLSNKLNFYILWHFYEYINCYQCDCHTLISSRDHPLLGCDPRLTTSRYLAPIVRKFVKFRDMPEAKRKASQHNP